MYRKLLLGLLILVNGLLIFPEVFAWERDENDEHHFVVHEYFVKAALAELQWLVIPREWREGLSLPLRQQEELLGESQDGLQAEELPLPTFAYSKIVMPLSEKHGMDWKLVAAVMAVESNYNPRAISSKGAVGLMQLMPRTAALYSVTYKELFNPRKNIEAGVRHLKKLHERYDGDLPLILAAYNSGETAVNRFNGIPPYRHTKAFVRKVMTRYQTHMQNELQAVSVVSGSLGSNMSIASPGPAVAYK